MGTPKTLRGVVVVTDRDEEGQIAGYSVVGDDSNEYFIDPFSRAFDVVDHLDEWVEVSGTVYRDDGLYTISVRDYRVLTGSGDS